MERLLPLIKAVLGSLWDRRFREALAKAKSLGHTVSVSEAYRKGYSEGYWDGINDLTTALNQGEEELSQRVRDAAVTPIPASWQRGGSIAEA